MTQTTCTNNFGLLAIMAALLMTAVPSPAAEDVVALRQADMKAMAAAAKTISGMFRDPASYKADDFKWAADSIRDRSGVVLAGHFASEVASPQSKAKPNILEERDRFDRLANDLRDYAVALGRRRGENPRTDARQHAHEAWRGHGRRSARHPRPQRAGAFGDAGGTRVPPHAPDLRDLPRQVQDGMRAECNLWQERPGHRLVKG